MGNVGNEGRAGGIGFTEDRSAAETFDSQGVNMGVGQVSGVWGMRDALGGLATEDCSAAETFDSQGVNGVWGRCGQVWQVCVGRRACWRETNSME